MRRLFLSGLCATLIAAQAAADTQPVNQLPSDLKTLPDTIDRALSEFYTPGMSVGIVKNGKIVYLAGHGLRDK